MPIHQKPELLVTAFSDYICPFCYIGFLRLEKLRTEYDVKVNWCLLEIHPENPAEGRPATELGYSDDQWQEMMGELGQMARQEGVSLCGRSCTTNSYNALLLGEAAKGQGRDIFYALHRRLFEAYLCEGQNIGDPEILKTLAIDAGISKEAVEQAWTDTKHKTRLQHNLMAAQELEISETPTFFIGERKLVGAASTDDLFCAAREALAAESKVNY